MTSFSLIKFLKLRTGKIIQSIGQADIDIVFLNLPSGSGNWCNCLKAIQLYVLKYTYMYLKIVTVWNQ